MQTDGRFHILGDPARIACAVISLAAIAPLSAVDPYTPAQFRGGSLPVLPVQAVGGGEVYLEVSVNSAGAVTDVKPLRTSSPFTEALTDAVGAWQFRPAEEAGEPAPGQTPDPSARKRIDARVFLAGMFRPPTLNAPTLGTPSVDVAAPSDDVPFPTAAVPPLYPLLARDSGVVLVEVRVGRAGNVIEANAVRSSPAFDAPALDAARRWTFRPARLHGAPVEAFAYIVFGFRQPVI
jgi:TonB family protein